MSDARAVRRRLGLTQGELAALVGAHPMTVSKWERGVLRPPRHQARLLRALSRAAPAGPAARDPVRRLAELLGTAYARLEEVEMQLSASNCLAGRIVEIRKGIVTARVVLEVARGVRIVSVITTDSVDRLGLKVGSRAVAVVKATDVVIGKPGR